MKFADRRAILFYKMICAFAVGFFAFISSCSAAFAYDDGYVGNSKYWNDKGEIVNISNDDFDGCLKYIVDEENCCMYFYLSFYDSLLTESSDSSYLIFKVKNSKNDYVITVGKDGIIADNELNVENNFNVYYDFSKVNPKYHGGEIFVAVEFKNSDDKSSDNTVSCEYSCGKNNNFDIKKDIAVNMVQTTVPVTTEKATKTTTEKTTKSTSVKSTTAKTTKPNTEKSVATKTLTSRTAKSIASAEKSTTEKTTKFSPSAVKKNGSSAKKSSSQSIIKFSAEKSNSDSVSVKSNEITDVSENILNGSETFEAEDLMSNSSGATSALSDEKNVSENHRTNASKILFAFGITVFILGTFLVLSGALKGKYKIVKNDDLKENAETEEDDSTADEK